jgi:D-alanyl-D-alanine carboxypeptidase/D-alanyl-D-alanine carboxypeptidase (penicillin-binding protein 5/6)
MKRILSLCCMAVIAVLCPLSAYAETETLSVSAKAAVLIEETTGRVIFEKNSGEKLPMASTTKIMTALLCIESGNLDDEFVVDSEAIKVEGSSMGLTEGDVVTKRALCYGMLLPSGNDAANAAAVKIGGTIENFASMMNERAAEIGMTRTCFVTPSGLEGEGHGASAYDMALLAREALKNPVFAEICSQEKAKVSFGNPPYERWLYNSNKLLEMYEGVKGVKTGFTDEAGRCLVSSCERDGVSMICVTLNDGDDWNDHMKMYDYGFSVLKKASLSSDEIFQIAAAGGECEQIPVKAEGEITYATDGMTENRISSELFMPPFVYAPLSVGDTVGELKFYYDGRIIGSLPVKAMKKCDFVTANKQSTGVWDKIKGFLFNKA